MTGDDLADLVEYATELATSERSDDILSRAALLAADTVGVTLAGGRRPEAVRLVSGDDLTGSWRRADPGAGPAATLLVAGGGLAAPDRAAFVNATVIGALEMDEGVRPTGHPSLHVLPATLAAAEALGRSWREAIRAYLAGYEVAAGLFTAYAFRGALHPHGHLGGVGAAVAVALIAGTDPLAAARTAAALPLLTTWPTCVEGADVRNAWAGHSAAVGLLAHRLLAAGFRESHTALDAAFDGLVADRRPNVSITPDEPYVLGGYVKLHSACALTHAGIDAAAKLAPVDPTAVARVAVEVNAVSMRIAQQAAPTPLGRRFSVPYAVAIALLHGAADPARLDSADEVAEDLAAKVTVTENPQATVAWPRRASARVRVHLVDDNIREAFCDEPRGHPAAPVGEPELRAKFTALAGAPGECWARLTDPRSDEPVRAVLTDLVRRFG